MVVASAGPARCIVRESRLNSSLLPRICTGAECEFFPAFEGGGVKLNRTSCSSCNVPSFDRYSTPLASPVPFGRRNVMGSPVFAIPVFRSNTTPFVSTCTMRDAAISGFCLINFASSALIKSICTSPLQSIFSWLFAYRHVRVCKTSLRFWSLPNTVIFTSSSKLAASPLKSVECDASTV